MGTEHVRRLVAGCAVIGVLAAGCSDAEGDPPGAEPSATEQSPTTSATPEKTASPGPGPTPWPEPTRPAAMERDDIEGAKAAAEYFLELFTYAQVTGDLDAWNQISHPDCVFCSSVADRVNAVHNSGGYLDGPVLDVTKVDAETPNDEYEYFSVWVDGNEGASTQYDVSGTPVETFEPSDLEMDLALTPVEGGWKVRGVVVDSTQRRGNDG